VTGPGATMTPFTLLTGFLGAGKTTVLNRMLSAPLGRRIAVLVNELGRVAIDSRLIVSRGGDVLELAGGCVCCKIDVKNDLWDGIADIVLRSRPDAVVLETTGIAEPPAIFEGLDRVPGEVAGRIVPAGIVCVVDAEAGPGALARREEARVQVECADRLLLSKLDLASAEEAAACHRALDDLNPGAERASFPDGEDASRALTAWILERRRPGAARSRPHAHAQGQLTAVSFVDAAPLLAEPLLQAIEELRDRLYRVKGFVHVAGESRRGHLELAGSRLRLDLGDPWGDEPPRSELVVIGEALDEASVRRRLWACRVAS
jgi:G3E family GTPase